MIAAVMQGITRQGSAITASANLPGDPNLLSALSISPSTAHLYGPRQHPSSGQAAGKPPRPEREIGRATGRSAPALQITV